MPDRHCQLGYPNQPTHLKHAELFRVLPPNLLHRKHGIDIDQVVALYLKVISEPIIAESMP
jgi:hypothetical protein